MKGNNKVYKTESFVIYMFHSLGVYPPNYTKLLDGFVYFAVGDYEFRGASLS